MAENQSKKKKAHRITKPQHKKLSRLPDNAHVTKRPLLRPAIPSPYSGPQNQKIVYVSTKTPFLSAIKRVEKLLHLADKRLVQSATTLTKEGKGKVYGKRKRGAEEDEILEIAETVESLKKRKKEDGGVGKGEEIVVRGTGKAIHKVLELGLWFQQKEEYAIRLVTGSVGAVDDIEVDEEDTEAIVDDAGQAKGQEPLQIGEDAEVGAANDDGGADQMDVDSPKLFTDHGARIEGINQSKSKMDEGSSEGRIEIPETRIRYTSSLEVYVSLR